MTEAFYEHLAKIRHQIHQHPEVSEEEHETTVFLKGYLKNLGIEPLNYPLKTGLIAEIGSGHPIIALRADILDGVSAIIGYHNNPHLKPGQIGLRSGAIMAGVEQFRVDVKGVSSHAARPDLGVDTVLVITTIINNLQQIVARTVSPFESAVLSVTHIEVGNTWNVLPAAGFFEGTIRTFEPKVREDVIARFEKVVQATADQFGAQVDITWGNSPYVTYNDQTLTPLIFENSKAFAEVIETLPSTGGEDFAAYQKEIPGVFAFVGSNGEENAPDWHHDDFLVKDEALPVAVNYYVENALFLLDYFKE